MIVTSKDLLKHTRLAQKRLQKVVAWIDQYAMSNYDDFSAHKNPPMRGCCCFKKPPSPLSEHPADGMTIHRKTIASFYMAVKRILERNVNEQLRKLEDCAETYPDKDEKDHEYNFKSGEQCQALVTSLGLLKNITLSKPLKVDDKAHIEALNDCIVDILKSFSVKKGNVIEYDHHCLAQYEKEVFGGLTDKLSNESYQSAASSSRSSVRRERP